MPPLHRFEVPQLKEELRKSKSTSLFDKRYSGQKPLAYAYQYKPKPPKIKSPPKVPFGENFEYIEKVEVHNKNAFEPINELSRTFYKEKE